MAKKYLFDYKGASPRVTPWMTGSKPPLPLVYSQRPMALIAVSARVKRTNAT